MISIIDDDRAARDSLRFLLECAGIEAREFASCDAFLRCGNAVASDCLVLDVHMPGMTGIELLEDLRGRGETIPAIVVTGRPSSETTARAEAAGALAVLEKPFSPNTILTLIRSTLSAPETDKPRQPLPC